MSHCHSAVVIEGVVRCGGRPGIRISPVAGIGKMLAGTNDRGERVYSNSRIGDDAEIKTALRGTDTICSNQRGGADGDGGIKRRGGAERSYRADRDGSAKKIWRIERIRIGPRGGKGN